MAGGSAQADGPKPEGARARSERRRRVALVRDDALLVGLRGGPPAIGFGGLLPSVAALLAEVDELTAQVVKLKAKAEEVAREAELVKEAKEAKEGKVAKEAKAAAEAKEANETKEAKEAIKAKAAQEANGGKAAEEAKAAKEVEEAKEAKAAEEGKGGSDKEVLGASCKRAMLDKEAKEDKVTKVEAPRRLAWSSKVKERSARQACFDRFKG
mmetsp:Transcript_81891/g.265295  ORF Transcript_81891/g.265295 Transcript_81891/m.265295 type:complete len:212 (-) Transcript_81891:47-682(-)